VRIGLLGLGSAGMRHSRAFLKIPGVSLIGADLDAERRAGARAHGMTVVPTLADLLATAPDAAVIAVPHAYLAEAALGALEAGCHVLLEKPMATTLEDAQRVLDAARTVGRHVMISFVHRFRPDVAAARDLIARGVIGRPTLVVDTMAGGASDMPAWVWRRAEAGGGMMFYNGIHQVDRVRFLLGDEADRVRAEVRTLAHDVDTEDTVGALVTFRGGALAVIVQHKAPADALAGWETQVFGMAGSLLIRTGQEVRWTAGGTASSLPGSPEDRFLGAATEFVSALEAGRAPSPSGADGVAALRIVLEMYGDAPSV